MKTRELTRGAMLCALYGVVLLFNNVLALGIETYFPWLLAFPVFIASLELDRKAAWVTLLAMVGLTFIFSGITTWLTGCSFLLCGFIFGRSWKTHGLGLVSLGLTFVILTLMNLLSMTILAGVFGFDLSSELAGFEWVLSYMSVSTVLMILAAFLSFTQVIAMWGFSTLLIFRLPGLQKWRKPVRPLRIWPGFAWTGPIFLGVWIILRLNVISLPMFCTDLIVLILMLHLGIYDWKGTTALLGKWAQKGNQNAWTVCGLIFCAFIPVINLPQSGYGWWRLLRECMTRKETTYENL